MRGAIALAHSPAALRVRIFTADSLGIGLVLVTVAGEARILAEPGGIEQRELHMWRKVYNLASAQRGE